MRLHRSKLYRPVPKQLEFHALGKTKRERGLIAANQVGKTFGAGQETHFHVTGNYPDWWPGRRFTKPTHGWVASQSNELTRDNPQKMLLGDPLGIKSDGIGTGTIPLSCIAGKPSMAAGFPNLVDKIQIKHVSGGISTIQFKAYEQGVKRWAGATLDWIWLDEEPPEDIYGEALARLTSTGGFMYMTLTPLMGMSKVVSHFYPDVDSDDRGAVYMDLEDAEHITPAERVKIIAGYPEYQRDARAHGKPMLGSGAVFPVKQSDLEVQAFPIPDHWPILGGFDFGYGDHPTAVIKIAWDRDSDCIYLTATYKEKRPLVSLHASSIRGWSEKGENLRYAWPHDGLRKWGESGPIKDQYSDEGVSMLREHSTFKTGGYSTEAGVLIILTRMQTGKFKVFQHLSDFFHEIASYHRKEGVIVAEGDDLISALRQAVMMLRYARVPEGLHVYADTVASDYDEFAQPGEESYVG